MKKKESRLWFWQHGFWASMLWSTEGANPEGFPYSFIPINIGHPLH